MGLFHDAFGAWDDHHSPAPQWTPANRSQSSRENPLLQKEVDRLGLICEALWRVLKNKLSLTDEELMAEMARLDLSDGKADGKAKKGPIDCPGCGKTNSRRHDYCIYCGQLTKTSPFD